MKVIFLGTGSSLGVPIPTCSCKTCCSLDPKDNRLRTSIYIELDNCSFIIDCGPDFRQQVLSNNITNVDFILLTHKHNDHVGGMDDVRPFNFNKKEEMKVYGTKETLEDIKKRFYYSFEERRYPGAPKFDLIEVQRDREFDALNNKIIPIEVFHGNMPILGYRIGDFTYITDAKFIEEDQVELIKGSKYLVINALRPDRKHKMHFDLDDALEFIDKIEPQKAFITHLSHKFPLHEELMQLLPDNVVFAYDGLRFKT
jgi:phosphoribosyl 1,2-cyclic phosphate phosphodiesterase